MDLSAGGSRRSGERYLPCSLSCTRFARPVGRAVASVLAQRLIQCLRGGRPKKSVDIVNIPLSGAVGLGVRVQHQFMALVCGNGMTKSLRPVGLGKPLVFARGSRAGGFVVQKEVWTVSTPPFALLEWPLGRYPLSDSDTFSSWRPVSENEETSAAGHPSHHRLRQAGVCLTLTES